ncbi:SDR family NAD(P)-dependent oxidoreductase [Trabulsiella odontotermitis]|uniref:SDR family NAD(P)-dependent oxidoreductase n=1 Tax=Trabulsiella odontotermitis TaxID=379893 RepID=UPI000676A9EC|nr:glucose 1-dehydrogenase [Trabulsiella odontotermitis]KNC91512.1 3-oxoacyl-ACP reductase [Trabulsiella odontotermitis]
MSEIHSHAFSLAGRTALVTGANRGIGKACAIALGKAGASVALACRNLSEGNTLAAEMQQQGIRTFAVEMDMLSLTSVTEAISQVAALSGGKIDILVNNAGLSHPAAALEVTADDFDEMFSLNVKGAFFASQAVAHIMKAQGGGTIINIASQAGIVALPGEPVYCMTKAAMIHMTKCLAAEWAQYHIRVNAVAPTFTRTDSTQHWLNDPAVLASLIGRIPLGRVAETEDIAAPVVFLSSPASAMITGAVLAIDGGWTLV